MKPASSHKPLSQFSLLLQGPPKSRKTAFALQFPRPYILDCDNNVEGTMRWRKKNGLPNDFFYDIPDVLDNGQERTIIERYGFCADRLKEAAMSKDIDTIIVDGVTKFNTYIIAEIGRIQGRKPGEMQLQDWNAHLYIWQNFITKMQACPKMFILIAHEQASDRTDLPGTLINIPGKQIQSSIAGMFSDVWRSEITDKLDSSGKRIYEWKIRAVGKTGLSLGNSLGLPDEFVADWKTVSAALNS